MRRPEQRGRRRGRGRGQTINNNAARSFGPSSSRVRSEMERRSLLGWRRDAAMQRRAAACRGRVKGRKRHGAKGGWKREQGACVRRRCCSSSFHFERGAQHGRFFFFCYVAPRAQCMAGRGQKGAMGGGGGRRRENFRAGIVVGDKGRQGGGRGSGAVLQAAVCTVALEERARQGEGGREEEGGREARDGKGRGSFVLLLSFSIASEEKEGERERGGKRGQVEGGKRGALPAGPWPRR